MLIAGSRANLAAKDAQGQRPAHLAAIGGHVGVLEVLQAQHVALNAKDRHGKSPLDLAAARGHTGLSNLLRPAQDSKKTLPRSAEL